MARWVVDDDRASLAARITSDDDQDDDGSSATRRTACDVETAVCCPRRPGTQWWSTAGQLASPRLSSPTRWLTNCQALCRLHGAYNVADAVLQSDSFCIHKKTIPRFWSETIPFPVWKGKKKIVCKVNGSKKAHPFSLPFETLSATVTELSHYAWFSEPAGMDSWAYCVV